jgi:hypothetical protein
VDAIRQREGERVPVPVALDEEPIAYLVRRRRSALLGIARPRWKVLIVDVSRPIWSVVDASA